MADYLFDLTGYLLLRGAVAQEHVMRLCRGLDDVLGAIRSGEPPDGIDAVGQVGTFGYVVEHVVEAGRPFEDLIAHPSWSPLVRRYCGGEPYLVHSAAYVRSQGDSVRPHSGGHVARVLNRYGFVHGQFCCGMLNVIIALDVAADGDGRTMLIPGSHKANIAHPELLADGDDSTHSTLEGVAGAKAVDMAPGDALLFSDAVTHGSETKTTPGGRRAILLRYAPQWDRYRASGALLARLGDEERRFFVREGRFD